MDNIQALFFDKKDRRKYQLFSSILSDPRRELHLNRVVTNYTATRKTMMADRLELEKDLISLSGKSLIKKNARSIVKIDEEAGAYAQKLGVQYAKESRMFKLMDAIVQTQNPTIKEICLVLYISPAAFRTSIAHLNHLFKDVSIGWSTSGISGDERKIRHLLFESYWGIFGGYSWPFKKSRGYFLKEIVSFEQEGMVFNKVEKERLLYWLAITELRIKRACFIKNNPKQVEKTLVKFGPVNNLISNLIGPYKEVEYVFDTESVFFMNTLIYVIKSTVSFSETQKEYLLSPIMIPVVEKSLSQYGESNKLSMESYHKLTYHLAKASYYINEELDNWYHFIKKETPKYFSENASFLKREIKTCFKSISDSHASIYVAECKNAGIQLVEPLRIMIISREAQADIVEQVLQKYSEYPIEVCQNFLDTPDLFLTNFSSESCIENSKIHYEWPLREPCIVRIIEKGLEMKKLKNLASSMS